VRAAIDVDIAKNMLVELSNLLSQDETAYFSPSNHYSAELNLSHDWVTWREYERSRMDGIANQLHN
jgi:hypothetical protein